MGNSAGKESKAGRSRPGSLRNFSTSEAGPAAPQTPTERFTTGLYGSSGRGGGRTPSRTDLALLHLGISDREIPQQEQRRETKQERDARRLEKEKIAREKERERSLKEEHVDGGFLVTLGTYTGPEDFNKTIVRQLQIERRLAPFWTGLNDYKDSWAEHQLVAAVRGQPIPAADEPPPEAIRTGSDTSLPEQRPTEGDVSRLTLPITSRSPSTQSDLSTNLSASHPAFSGGGALSSSTPPSTLNLFRGRAKTLASLTSTSRSDSTTQLTPQEMQLPKNPNVNGQPVEVYLYKDAAECPICFLCYPPYLNKTRCCDQPICSECFVQIKRPDPHPPEHHDDPSNPNPEPPAEEEVNLVSEPSSCPFCVTPEFGVTYEPPPFRRGLAYANNNHLAFAASAMSSSTSLGSMGSRRRTTSLSANDKAVITTDRIRPDWAKKLADARAHALRRSAAATALHNAAYVLGNTQNLDLRAFALGRRRRLFGEGSSGGPSGLGEGGLSAFLGRPAESTGQSDGESTPQRGPGGRRTRMEDIEELMMMEAIRLSLAAEEDRKRKEEKDAAKDAKKRAKEEAKQAKKAEKAQRKAEKAGSLYAASTNQSTSTWASTSMTRSTSNLGLTSMPGSPPGYGKGKAPATNTLGFNPLDEPTSTLNRDTKPGESSKNAQRHLEDSRANLTSASQPISLPVPTDGAARGHSRQFSGASSVASSILESGPGSYRNDAGFGTPPNASGVDLTGTGDSRSGTPPNAQHTGLEPMFNFRSLAAMIGEEDKAGHEAEHREHADGDQRLSGVIETEEGGLTPMEGNRARGYSGGSSSSGPHLEGISKTNTDEADSANNRKHAVETHVTDEGKTGGLTQ